MGTVHRRTSERSWDGVAAQAYDDAAQIMSANPTALQLRYLQTLLELGSSQASTIVFPLPIDLLKPLLQATQLDGTENHPPPLDPSEHTLGAADDRRAIAGGATQMKPSGSSPSASKQCSSPPGT